MTLLDLDRQGHFNLQHSHQQNERERSRRDRHRQGRWLGQIARTRMATDCAELRPTATAGVCGWLLVSNKLVSVNLVSDTSSQLSSLSTTGDMPATSLVPATAAAAAGCCHWPTAAAGAVPATAPLASAATGQLLLLKAPFATPRIVRARFILACIATKFMQAPLSIWAILLVTARRCACLDCRRPCWRAYHV